MEGGYRPGQVIVKLKTPYLGETPEELFPELDIAEIKDLYAPIYENAKNLPQVDPEKLEELRKDIGTMYLVKLTEETKESVLDAIELLKSNSYVKYASANAILQPG